MYMYEKQLESWKLLNAPGNILNTLQILHKQLLPHI